MSLRDSIVDIGKFVHIVIKKKNELSLYIGHSDSAIGLKEDNYEIDWQGKDAFVTIWFGVAALDKEESYEDIKLFIQFLDENRKVDGEDGSSDDKYDDSGRWTKFKDSHFNYGTISEIPPSLIIQTNPLQLKFPSQGKYTFRYSLYADGYKPKSGSKTIIVK